MKKLINQQLSDLMIGRLNVNMEGKLWSEEVNRLLGIKREYGLEEAEKPAQVKRASGWGYFELRKTG